MQRAYRIAFTIVALLALRVLPAIAADGHADDARNFVETYIRGSVAIRTDPSLAPDQKALRTRQLLHETYDFAGSPHAMLGRYWDKATPDQQSRYRSTFEDYLVSRYAPHFDDIANHLKVTGSSEEEARTIVHTVYADRPEDPTAIDWVLVPYEGRHWRVTDVIVNGADSTETMKQEFLAVLRANNGDLEALLTALKQRIEAARHGG